jgi:hypothetical protein
VCLSAVYKGEVEAIYEWPDEIQASIWTIAYRDGAHHKILRPCKCLQTELIKRVEYVTFYRVWDPR